MKTKDKVANAIKWIDGLLVTRHKQGRKRLGNREVGFCCLGYGCHVIGIDYIPTMGFSRNFAVNVGLSHREGFLIPEEAARVGADYTTLADLNDRAGWSFNQIAKLMIRRNFSMFDGDVADKLVEHYKKA